MITEVDNYRGFEIRFDTDKETFNCDIDDERSVKKSYGAIKTFIDEYIKENNTFKPFKVIKSPVESYGGSDGTIIGVRKDGRFIIELPSGKKDQVSDYDLSKYWVVKDGLSEKIKEADPILASIKIAKQKYDELCRQKEDFYESIKATTLKDYKKQQHG